MIFRRRRTGGQLRRRGEYKQATERYKNCSFYNRQMVGNIGLRQEWTMAQLEDLNTDETHRELAVRMGRSLNSVVMKCWEIKLAIKNKGGSPAMKKRVVRVSGTQRVKLRKTPLVRKYVENLEGVFRPMDEFNRLGPRFGL